MLVPPIDHLQEGLARVIMQYRGKPRFCKYLLCLLDMVQVLENQIHETHRVWQLENATSWRLDVIGALVGQLRIGQTDAEYKVYIQARIRANRSIGKLADLLGIADLLMPGYTYDVLGNNVIFRAPGVLSEGEATAIQAMLQHACSQGGRVWLLMANNTPDLLFASTGECIRDTGTVYYATGAGAWNTVSGSSNAGYFAGSRA